MPVDFFKEFEERKKKIKILLLGAYSPSIFEERLSRIRDVLVKRNYLTAKIVRDFPDKPAFHGDKTVHIVEKSQFYIKYWADVIIFVFSDNASNEGVAIEFEFCCTKVPEKLGFSVVFSEESLHLSSLILGSISLNEIKAETFKDENELCEKLVGYLTNFVHRLYWYL